MEVDLFLGGDVTDADIVSLFGEDSTDAFAGDEEGKESLTTPRFSAEVLCSRNSKGICTGQLKNRLDDKRLLL
jgi:hypothetical protein